MNTSVSTGSSTSDSSNSRYFRLPSRIPPANERRPSVIQHAPSQSIVPSGEIYVAGFPSAYGGADTELDHMIDLWRRFGVAVHLVPNGGITDEMRAMCARRGLILHPYRPDVFAGKAVVSFCNGDFLKRLPEIVAAGRPRCVLWANCMTWNFDAEVSAHAARMIDVHLFQSEYQKKLVTPKLEATGVPVRALTGFRPFFHLDNALQQLKFEYRAPTDYFGMGRVSRDDGAKFPEDFWRIFGKVNSPLPTKTFVLGFGPNAQKKCGKIPTCNWLDYMVWGPGSTTAKDVYRRLHVLIHKTGGSRENWPRTVLEAFASGVAVIAEDDYAMGELIENGVNGFLCRTSDEMSHRASELAFNEPLRKKMVHAAYERFLDEHANPERSFAPWRNVVATPHPGKLVGPIMTTPPVSKIGVPPRQDGKRRVHIIVDVEGWAYHFLALSLQRHAPDNWVVTISTDPASTLASSQADGAIEVVLCLVYPYTEKVRKNLEAFARPPVLISSFNCGWKRDGKKWTDFMRLYADFVMFNNRDAWLESGLGDSSGYISNGINRNVFNSERSLEEREVKAMWAGSNIHAVLKGADIIREIAPACAAAGIPIDALQVDSRGAERRTQSQMNDWYNSGQFYLCLSESEGTPNPALEAAACGCVLVTTRVGNMPELITDKWNGVLLDDRKPETILAGLRYAKANRDRLAANMATCIGEWDWRFRAARYFDLFERLIARNASADRTNSLHQARAG